VVVFQTYQGGLSQHLNMLWVLPCKYYQPSCLIHAVNIQQRVFFFLDNMLSVCALRVKMFLHFLDLSALENNILFFRKNLRVGQQINNTQHRDQSQYLTVLPKKRGGRSFVSASDFDKV